MSPQIHDRHSLVFPDGTDDDELAEALLETQRELSQPIPLHLPPEGFLERIMRRTLQVVEVVLAFIFLRVLWTQRALAAGLVGTTAMVGLWVASADFAGPQLPPVEAHRGVEADNATTLLARLAVSPGVRRGAVPFVPRGPNATEDLALPGEASSLQELTRRAAERPVARAGLYWAGKSVDRVIAKAMRKYGMSPHSRRPVSDGWRCHETEGVQGGLLAYKHYYDAASGQTLTRPVRCFRL